MKKKTLILKVACIICAVFLVLMVFYINCKDGKQFPSSFLIAHAGGGLGNITYLNSKEAVENSIRNGFHYIELDLLETSDGDILAAHKWEDFHKLTGFEGENAPISADEARQRKILNNQTVLTSKEINDIFLSHPDVYLVTDKIQNINLLEQKFGSFKNRIIVEVFSLKKYKEVQEKGFFHAAFCVWNQDNLYQLVEENNIDMVTLPTSSLSKRKDWYRKHPHVVALAFGQMAEQPEQIKKHSFIRGWYTDSLVPKMLEDK